MNKTEQRKKFRNLPFKDKKRFITELFNRFTLDMGLFHGAALSFYLVFTLIPLLYLTINIIGSVVGKERVTEFVNRFLIDYFGIDDFSGVLSFLNSIEIGGSNFLLKYIGIIVLVFSCTAIFISLKVSINHFYGITPHFESGKKKFLVNVISRLISFALLTGMGALLVVTYFVQFVFNSVGKLFLKEHILMSNFWFEIVQHTVSILSMMVFLMFIYKYLNDAVVKFRVAFVGAVFAAILLQIGQLGIQYYMNVAYFAKSGSLLSVILIILAFVYYGSQAIFIGASVSAAYGELVDEPIVSKYVADK